ncbi:hypothetical protein ASF48_01100 [Rathayibacter sp. Leaf299]|jgi:hypothetical protein|uniref:hypothetical protein n=1 Tax=Rathayibacter sp. Leaf299 TaxID=1736328 RepID=UPI0006F343E7|nr:hypothetical protein [Rathayibacter sp. Leaf299]KQQ21874.1 hypothetical protein ASF48_01100 [Rathayibacter sp. Leaf299]
MIRLLRSLRHLLAARLGDLGAGLLASALDRAAAHDPRGAAAPAWHSSAPRVNGGAAGEERDVALPANRTIRHDQKEDPMTDKTTPGDVPDTETVDPEHVDPDTATDPEGDPVENPSG